MRRRALLALVGAILWMAGVELVPNLHLALHDSLAAHVHEGDTTVFAHGHAHRVTQKCDRRAAEQELALRLQHGAHSLAHHGVAIKSTPPPLLAPLPIDRRAQVFAEIAIIEPASRTAPTAQARGPPVA